jgi:hypothetical protein
MVALPSPTLRAWSKDNRLSAGHLNESPNAINQILYALASSEQQDGTPAITTECWPGIISATGPNGQADFTDERYWVARSFIKGAAPNSQITVQQEVTASGSSGTTPSGVGSDQNASNIFVVSNFLEMKTHLHSVAAGVPVWVWAYWDSGLTAVQGSRPDENRPPDENNQPVNSQPDNQKHYVMSVYARPVFKITGNATKPGTYTANPMKPPTAVLNASSSSALAETDFGVVDTTTTVYLINIVEKGAATGHTQAAGAIIPGDFRGFASDGKPVFEIEAC